MRGAATECVEEDEYHCLQGGKGRGEGEKRGKMKFKFEWHSFTALHELEQRQRSVSLLRAEAGARASRACVNSGTPFPTSSLDAFFTAATQPHSTMQLRW
jgi:hypothetical protein